MATLYKNYPPANELYEVFGETIGGFYHSGDINSPIYGYTSINRSACSCGNKTLPITKTTPHCPKCGKDLLFFRSYTRSNTFDYYKLLDDNTLKVARRNVALVFNPNGEDITLDWKEDNVYIFKKDSTGVITVESKGNYFFRFPFENITPEIEAFFGDYLPILKKFQNISSTFSTNNIDLAWFKMMIQLIEKVDFMNLEWAKKNYKTLYSIIYAIREEVISLNDISSDVSIEDIMDMVNLPSQYIPFNIIALPLIQNLVDYLPEFSELEISGPIFSRLRNEQLKWEHFVEILNIMRLIHNGDFDNLPKNWWKAPPKVNHDYYQYFEGFLKEKLDEIQVPAKIVDEFKYCCSNLEELGVLVNADSLRTKNYNSLRNSSKLPLKKNMDINGAILQNPLELWQNINASALKSDVHIFH